MIKNRKEEMFALTASVPAVSTIFETDRKANALLAQLNIDNGAMLKHCKGVNFFAALLADKLNLPQREQLELDWGTTLHDLGKLDVGIAILQKQEPLTDLEWKRVKEHPVLGFQRARVMGFPEEVADIILYHHERYDGNGYPFGLGGSEIPLLARICSVVDSFDAMVSDRPYRKAMAYENACQELRNNRGSQFDPQIVDCFLDIQHEYFTLLQFSAN